MDPNTDGRQAAASAPVPSLLAPWMWALCGTGCGLVLWVALSSAMLRGGDGIPRALVELQAWALGLGALLAAAGLGLLWPRPAAPGAWWRRSLMALLTVIASALVLALLQWRPQPDPTWPTSLAVLACGSALAAILGLALLEQAQAGLLVPARLAQALLCGATLLFAMLALLWSGPLPEAGPVPSLLLLVAVAGGLLAAARHGQGGLFPWQQWRRRWLALGLLVAVPLLLVALLYLQPGWGRVIWPLVALSVFAGTVAERLPPR